MNAEADHLRMQAYSRQKMAELRAAQGHKKPINGPEDYGQGIWPENDSIEDFNAWLHLTRREEDDSRFIVDPGEPEV